MEAFLFNPAILQPIVNILTESDVVLDTPRSPSDIALTHAAANLRATCKTLRAMIPAPTPCHPTILLFRAARVGSLETAKLAHCYDQLEQYHTMCTGRKHVINRKPTSISFLIAAENRHMDVARFIWNQYHASMFDSDKHRKWFTITAARSGDLDACIGFLENDHHVHSDRWISKGAALGGHAHILDYLTQCKRLSYEAVFDGAAASGRDEWCERAFDEGHLDAFRAARIACKYANLNVCSFIRAHALQNNEVTVRFYTSLMASCVKRGCTTFLHQLRAWSIEDGAVPNYTTVILMAIFDSGDKYDIEREIEGWAILRGFCQLDGDVLDYSAILYEIADKSAACTTAIQQWVFEDGAPIDPFDPFDE